MCNFHLFSNKLYSLFYFLSYENMITHLQETWKIQNKVTYSSIIQDNYFLSTLRFLVGVLLSNSQKLVEYTEKQKDIVGFSGGPSGKEPACQYRRCKRCRFNPWVGKIPWRRAWQPLQYSCLENPIDRGASWAAVHRVTKSQIRLSTHARKSKTLSLFKVQRK